MQRFIGQSLHCVFRWIESDNNGYMPRLNWVWHLNVSIMRLLQNHRMIASCKTTTTPIDEWLSTQHTLDKQKHTRATEKQSVKSHRNRRDEHEIQLGQTKSFNWNKDSFWWEFKLYTNSYVMRAHLDLHFSKDLRLQSSNDYWNPRGDERKRD